MKKLIIVFVASLTIVSFNSCNKEDVSETEPVVVKKGLVDLNIDKSFDFKSTEEVTVNVSVKASNNDVLSNIRVDIYDSNPSNATKEGKNANLIYSGSTDHSGNLVCKLTVSKNIEKLYISPRSIGVATDIEVQRSPIINVNIGGSSSHSQNRSANIINQDNFLTIGGWNSSGLPNYIEQIPDIIDQGLLNDLTTSLPENVPNGIPATHPEFLDNVETNIELIEDAEVWITFVHEGAGYKNGLGYFTFPTGNPPASASAIENLTISFPNASYSGSGGELNSGDKVQLKYYDSSTQQFVETFPAGTTVGWFLVPNAWNGSTVNFASNIIYSIPEFNPESDASKKQHNVLLYDNSRNLMLIGFEDVNRETWSDEDFNDAVFYATSSPVSAIKTDNVAEMDSDSDDSDNDGVNDNADDYPNDPNLAYNNYYPNRNLFGTLAFEDLWPYLGDFDFNDVVIDYQYNRVCSANNSVYKIEAQFILRALGAHYKNGFGIELNVSPNVIESVTGYRVQDGYISLSSNGTESGQEKAVIIVFDNAFNILAHPGGGTGINTTESQTYVEPDTINISIVFNKELPLDDLGDLPYNPFIIIDKERGKEVHLPFNNPTSLADQSLLGTGQDNSDGNLSRYYLTKENIPWAINIPYKFDYAIEKEEIRCFIYL